MTTFTDESPLGDARDYVEEHLDAGVTCPCCTQRAQCYKRKLNASTARILIEMLRLSGTGQKRAWVNIPRLGLGRADEAKARYWGLIEPMPGVRGDGSTRTGWWRLTDRGVAFVRGATSVPKYVYLYNGRMVGQSDGEKVTITDVLGTKFNYAELMAGV